MKLLTVQFIINRGNKWKFYFTDWRVNSAGYDYTFHVQADHGTAATSRLKDLRVCLWLEYCIGHKTEQVIPGLYWEPKIFSSFHLEFLPRTLTSFLLKSPSLVCFLILLCFPLETSLFMFSNWIIANFALFFSLYRNENFFAFFASMNEKKTNKHVFNREFWNGGWFLLCCLHLDEFHTRGN